MKYAIVNYGIVENIIEINPENVAEFDGAIPLDDIPANIGDTYKDERFYRDGEKVLTVFEATQKEIEQYRVVLDILDVYGSIVEQVQAIRDAMDIAGSILTESQAAELIYLYRPWEPFTVSASGEFVCSHFLPKDRRRFDDAVYECIQDHNAEEQLTPDSSPDLWKKL